MNISHITKIGSVGYRFHPSDEELVGVYLNQKISGRDSLSNIISLPEVNNLYQLEPWELPNQLWPPEIDGRDQTWYFFHRQNANLKQQKRATKVGFWSITGTRRKIKDRKTKKEIGFKRTMTFYYKDRLHWKKKKEDKTPWVMHEYHLTANLPNQNTILLYKLKCKEYKKADISNDEVQLNLHPQLPNNEDNRPHDEIEQLSSPLVDNLNNNSKTNQQNIIVDNNYMNFPNELKQKETEIDNISNNGSCLSLMEHSPSNLEVSMIEGGSLEDWMEFDDLRALLEPFDPGENGQLSLLGCNELDIYQTSNKQNMVVHDGGFILPVMNMLSPDLSRSDLDTSTDETAGSSSIESQLSHNVDLPRDVRDHAMEDGSLEFQDWIENDELQAESTTLVHGFRKNTQQNINTENESFNSAFIGMVSPDEPLRKRSRLENFIMINV